MSTVFTSKAELMTYGQDLKLFLPEMGELQSQLYEGEYHPFKYAPVFESNFVQVTKKGEAIDIHNQVTLVTLAIAATSPNLPLPNVMLLARPKITNLDPKKKRDLVEQLQLSRLFPLKLVKLSVSDASMRQIKLKLASGRCFYLQLHAPLDKEDDLFQRWTRIIYLLQPTPCKLQMTRDHEFMLDSSSSAAHSNTSSDDKESVKNLAIPRRTVEIMAAPGPSAEVEQVYMQNDADDENLDESRSSEEHPVHSSPKKDPVHPALPETNKKLSAQEESPRTKKTSLMARSPSNKKLKERSPSNKKKDSASPVKQKPNKLQSVIKSFSTQDSKEVKKKKKRTSP